MPSTEAQVNAPISPKIPRREATIGGNAQTRKTVKGQAAKHMMFFETQGGQWVVDNIKCHYCAKCYSTKAIRDKNHLVHITKGDVINEKWTTAGNEDWVRSFKRS